MTCAASGNARSAAGASTRAGRWSTGSAPVTRTRTRRGSSGCGWLRTGARSRRRPRPRSRGQPRGPAMAPPEAADDLPRLAPELPLPPYSYVSGQFPHPFSHPEGHYHGAPAEPLMPPEPALWYECRSYLHGLDLFNRGYYWEAHETWEGLWHACGRAGPT